MKRAMSIVLMSSLCMLALCSCDSRQRDNDSSQTKLPEEGAGPLPAGEPGVKTGKEQTLDLGGDVTMKMVLIPAGKFTMGSPAGESGRDDVEGPAHEVTISKPFYMGVTHVTVDQFAAFVKDSAYKTDAEKDGWSVGFEIKDGKLDFKKMDGCSWRKANFDQRGDHPVVHVSWNDAKAFCDWLSKESGKTVRLPTEAQWEYACRAGTKTTYPWGDGPAAGEGWANCADQSLKKRLPNMPARYTVFPWDDGFVFTSPVGSFKPNAFGLYDMVGNAYQWCGDWYGEYERGAATDPMGPASGTLRVKRGSSWCVIPRSSLSAIRSGFRPSRRMDDYGFRVAVVVAGVD